VISRKSFKYNKISEAITAYMMLLPDLLGLFVFSFIAIIYAFHISMHDWNGLTEMKFIGISNYLSALGKSEFWISLWVTAKFVLMYVPAIFCSSLLLALFVQSIRGKMQQFYRLVYFLPHSISVVIAGLVWAFIYDPQAGYLNSILNMIGFEKQRFLYNPNQALPCIVLVNVWLALGFNMIIFLSALKEIPISYYEVAEIDGANFIHKFIYITLPLIRDTSIFIAIVSTIGAFQSFDVIMVMTGGGPVMSTTVTVLYIYKQAFEISKFGYASSISFLLFFIIMSLTLLQLKLFANENR